MAAHTPAMFADGPFAEYADKLMLYGRLIGAWNVVSTVFHPDGAQSSANREWHFAWALGGRAVQDVLFARGAPADRRGTTIRCYDPAIDAWRVVWMAPAAGEYVQLIGRADGDRIVQEGEWLDGRQLERWTFSDITPASFLWRGEMSADGGRTYRLEQEMRAVRS